MKIVITGGIGAGKTTVRNMMSEKLDNYVMASVDSMVSKLYEDLQMKTILNEQYGSCDKRVLSKLAFDDPILRQTLEIIFSKRLIDEIEEILQNENVILEFPLFYERGQKFLPLIDVVINVLAPDAQVVERVCKRDGKTKEEVYKIIKAQATNEQRSSISDYDIYVDSNTRPLEYQVNMLIDQMMKRLIRGKKIGIVSGSFDPITLGHTWIIQKALDVVDHVVITIATNPAKKYLFTEQERSQLVRETINEVLTPKQRDRVIIDFIPHDELLVSYAANLGAKFIFRGLRGLTDLEYESQLNLIQKKIAPEIETIFFITPRELIEISSSMIKNSLALREWKRVAEPYVSKSVLDKLRQVHKRS